MSEVDSARSAWDVEEGTFMQDVLSQCGENPQTFLQQLLSQPCFAVEGKARTRLLSVVQAMQQVHDEPSFLAFRKTIIDLRKALTSVIKKSPGHAFTKIEPQFSYAEKVSHSVLDRVNRVLNFCHEVDSYDGYQVVEFEDPEDVLPDLALPVEEPVVEAPAASDRGVVPAETSVDLPTDRGGLGEEVPESESNGGGNGSSADFVGGLEITSLNGHDEEKGVPKSVGVDIHTREELINRVHDLYWGSPNHWQLVLYFLDRSNEEITLTELKYGLQNRFSVRGEVQNRQIAQWIREMNQHVRKNPPEGLGLDFDVFEQLKEETYGFCSRASFREHIFDAGDEDDHEEGPGDVAITVAVNQGVVMALGETLDGLEPTAEERAVAEMVIRRAGNLVPFTILEERFPGYDCVELMNSLNAKYASSGGGEVDYFIHEVCDIGFYIGERPGEQIREMQERREALTNDICSLCEFDENQEQLLRYLCDDAEGRQSTREEICGDLDISDRTLTMRINAVNRLFAGVVKEEQIIVEGEEGAIWVQDFSEYGKTLRKAIGILKSGKKLKKLSARRLAGPEAPLELIEQDDEEILNCHPWPESRKKIIEYLLRRRGECVPAKTIAEELGTTTGSLGGNITFLNDDFFDIYGTSLIFSWSRQGYYIPKYNEPPKPIEVEPKLDERGRHITPKTIPHSQELIESCPGLTPKQVECLKHFLDRRGTAISPEAIARAMEIGKPGVTQYINAIRKKCLEYFGIPVLYNVLGKGYILPAFQEGEMTYTNMVGSAARPRRSFGGEGNDGEEDDFPGEGRGMPDIWGDPEAEGDDDEDWEEEDEGTDEGGGLFDDRDALADKEEQQRQKEEEEEDEPEEEEDGAGEGEEDGEGEPEKEEPKEGLDAVDWESLSGHFGKGKALDRVGNILRRMMEHPGAVFEFSSFADNGSMSLSDLLPGSANSYEEHGKWDKGMKALNAALRKAKVPFEVKAPGTYKLSVVAVETKD